MAAERGAADRRRCASSAGLRTDDPAAHRETVRDIAGRCGTPGQISQDEPCLGANRSCRPMVRRLLLPIAGFLLVVPGVPSPAHAAPEGCIAIGMVVSQVGPDRPAECNFVATGQQAYYAVL